MADFRHFPNQGMAQRAATMKTINRIVPAIVSPITAHSFQSSAQRYAPPFSEEIWGPLVGSTEIGSA